MNGPLLQDNLHRVNARITAAAAAAGRSPATVRLLAVSKTRPAEDLMAAFAAGQHDFGESYVQEALAKIRALAGHPLVWHFIGPIQSNKTREIAAHFHWVHSIDREKIARRLNEQRPAEHPPLNVCIQVNLCAETSKSGVSPIAAPALATAVADMPRLRLRGLMAIPAPTRDPARQRVFFGQLRQLQEKLIHQGLPLDTLSMGMSGDLEAAIAEGATIVRIGSALFGARPGRGMPSPQTS